MKKELRQTIHARLEKQLSKEVADVHSSRIEERIARRRQYHKDIDVDFRASNLKQTKSHGKQLENRILAEEREALLDRDDNKQTRRQLDEDLFRPSSMRKNSNIDRENTDDVPIRMAKVATRSPGWAEHREEPRGWAKNLQNQRQELGFTKRSAVSQWKRRQDSGLEM